MGQRPPMSQIRLFIMLHLMKTTPRDSAAYKCWFELLCQTTHAPDAVYDVLDKWNPEWMGLVAAFGA